MYIHSSLRFLQCEPGVVTYSVTGHATDHVPPTLDYGYPQTSVALYNESRSYTATPRICYGRESPARSENESTRLGGSRRRRSNAQKSVYVPGKVSELNYMTHVIIDS